MILCYTISMHHCPLCLVTVRTFRSTFPHIPVGKLCSGNHPGLPWYKMGWNWIRKKIKIEKTIWLIYFYKFKQFYLISRWLELFFDGYKCHICNYKFLFKGNGFPWCLCGKDSACKKMRVWSLGQEDPLEKEMATHSSILIWKNPLNRGAWQAIVHGVAMSQTWLNDGTTTFKGRISQLNITNNS